MTTVASIDYDEAVRMARALKTPEGIQWVLGDLANRIRPKYGERTLERFAEDVGVKYHTLRDYRLVANAFSENEGRPSFSIAREIYNQDDRYELAVTLSTSKAARKKVTERKAARTAAACRKDTCEGKPPVNPLPGLIKNVKEEWRLVMKCKKRLREDPGAIEAVEEMVGQMFADLAEIRSK